MPSFRLGRRRARLLSCLPFLAACSSSSAASIDAGSEGGNDAATHQDGGTSTDAAKGKPDAHRGDAGKRDGQAEDGSPRGDAEPDGALADGGIVADSGSVIAVTDDAGWTIFPGLPGTKGGYARAIYVDSVGGSDSNTGASADQALQTIAYGSVFYNLLKNNPASGIIVLLKPGSVWPSGMTSIPGGGTAEYPLLITGSRWPGATSTARPQIMNGMFLSGGSHIALEGLEFGPVPATNGASSGVDFSENGADYLVENCLFTHFYNLLVVGGGDTTPVTNLRVRRNYFFGAFGSGPVVAFDGNNIVGALFEDNFFDYNGGPDGNYLNDVETAPYSNEFAHDVYFASNGSAVIANDVTFRHNLFARTLQSIKGPYTGTLDDNLFYNYSSGGYVGSWGSRFSNNVLVNGGGFAVSLDNAHYPNTNPAAKTTFCSNLEYNEASNTGSAFQASTLGSSIVGVNLDYLENVSDGFQQAIDLDDQSCFGYHFENNLLQASQFFEVGGTWPQAACPLSASGNRYYSASGAASATSSAYALDLQGTYETFTALETFLGETNGTFEAKPVAFTDPTRNITSYLTSASLAPASPAPTLVDYLALVRAQGQTLKTWDPKLSVSVINAYVRDGHSETDKPLRYNAACP